MPVPVIGMLPLFGCQCTKHSRSFRWLETMPLNHSRYLAERLRRIGFTLTMKGTRIPASGRRCPTMTWRAHRGQALPMG